MAVFHQPWKSQTVGPALKAVRLATAAALPAVTQAGAGVGATLTADAVGVLTVDGVAVVLNDRVLVKNQAATDDNGIYLCTTEGTAEAAFVLTRATDFDQAAANEVARGEGALASEGTANAGTSWILTTSGTITVDTTGLTFAQGGGDDDVVTTDPVSTFANPTVGLQVTATEVNAPLVGYVEVQIANGAEDDVRNNRSNVKWRAYGGLTVAGAAVADGQLDVSGDTTYDIEFHDMPFGWMRFRWVGDTGSGTVDLTLSAKRV